MWKFNDLPYTRPDSDALKAALRSSIDHLTSAKDYAQAREAFNEHQKLRLSFVTMYTIASIRQTIDTANEFYAGEMAFLHRLEAEMIPLSKAALEALLATPFRTQFEEDLGVELFVKSELEKCLQDESIIQDRIEESDLEEEYKKIAASCKTTFKGEERNFYGLLKLMEDPDRATRKAAFEEWAKLYEGVSEQLDGVYDRLIAVRLRMAEKLGFNNYIEMAYAQKGRVDYTAKDVELFREQVREVIVPAALRYRQAQAARIGVDKLKYYDENYMFPDGNADPVGGEDVLLPIGQRMYRELSPETAEFFDFMIEH
ncbi:MAG: M3 family metallopeptidase, partial [Oscillospiraceae bacterium]|nr:M3 family metallopeptidase [Oscillospiraceae bacterium]